MTMYFYQLHQISNMLFKKLGNDKPDMESETRGGKIKIFITSAIFFVKTVDSEIDRVNYGMCDVADFLWRTFACGGNRRGS